MQKPSIPKGTRDFLPAQTSKRNYIFDTIKLVFLTYGYRAIETPAMENLSTLMGKYGEEGDKLLFKILNSGDYLSKVDRDTYQDKKSIKLTHKISEKGLRYDLTVPLARFVVQHRNEINLPFKRFQIQPVWRADRPQKGRYREFFQCDVDVLGSNSLLNEVELIQIIDSIFQRLNVNVVIKLNNRKILSGIAEILGRSDRIIDITVAIDKWDKIGLNGVNKELLEKGFTENEISCLQPIINLEGSNLEKLAKLELAFKESEIGLQGLSELKEILDYTSGLNLKSELELDLTLARGLNYYTGAIIEVKALDVAIGSICGGGRYDDLTGIFGMKGLSGVGVSFGADRIYDVLLQTEAFPKETERSTQVLIVNFGVEEAKYALKVASQLRENEIKTELYPDNVKMKRQMTYANKNNIPYVIIIGDKEIQEQKVSLKNMQNGEQQLLNINQLLNIFTHSEK